MYPKSLTPLAAALVASLAPTANAYWRMSCPGTLVEGRLDPIVTPGGVSSHTHVILGGNGFTPSMDYASTQKSTCTSCSIKGDLSNYWIPKLYYAAQNGSFIDVPVHGGTVYYQQRAEYPGKKLKAYPEGFRMTAGNPERRNFDDTSNAQKAITHVCLNYNGPAPVPEAPPLPPKNCPNGVRAQVYFPSCWDGKNLDSADHQSHMAYPSNYNSGTCPDSHPNPMISVFFEFIFDTARFANEWYGNKQPFVYSMGDDTGYGLHGDFLNGWDVATLQHGIDTKTTNDAGCAGDVTCNGIFQYPDHYGDSCTLPQMVNEPINGVLPALPGCNPVSSNPGQGTGNKAGCQATKTLGLVTGDIADVTADGWQYVGCGADDYYHRAMTKQLAATDDMTVEKCVQAAGAAGYAFAGLEYGRECWATNNLPASASPAPGVMGNCGMTCAGDAKHKCGDANKLSIYKKCTQGQDCKNPTFNLPGGNIGTAPGGDAGGATGGGNGATGGNGGATGGGNGATGGNGGATGGASGTTGNGGSKVQNPPAGGSTGGPTGSGSMPSGAPPEGANPPHQPLPSTYPANNAGAAKNLPTGWKNAGCYIDPVRPRALQGEQLAWYGTPITASNCAAHCDKGGYSMAGVENGGQCFCGNKLEAGSKPADKPDECHLPCDGGKDETCGGPGRLNLYVKGVAKRRRSALPLRGESA